MRIFELHFNQPPKRKSVAPGFSRRFEPEKVFDSFCYEPTNVYEKRMGALCLVGELTNALPEDNRLLETLAQVIKGKYYVFPLKSSEQSLKESLKRANEFLSGEVRKDNVNWLGNLNFAVLAIKKLDLVFTKVGEIKVLLLRGGRVTDISKNLELGEIEPYPLKVFTNLVSGNLAEGDLLLVLTKEAYELFIRSNRPIPSKPESPIRLKNHSTEAPRQTILEEISQLIPFEEKKLKDFLRNKEKLFSEISGICLLVDFSKAEEPEEQKVFNFAKEKEKFSFKTAFAPLIKALIKITSKLKPAPGQKKKPEAGPAVPPKKNKAPFSLPSFPKITLPRFPGFKSPRLKLPTVQLSSFKSLINEKNGPKAKKNLLLFGVLFLLLLTGFLFFKDEEKRQYRSQEIILNSARQKLDEAKNFLSINNEEQAAILLEEALREINSFSEEDWPLKSESIKLKNEIEDNLGIINKLEKIASPELFLEFNSKEFLPQKMVVAEAGLYLFSPISRDLVWLNPITEEQKKYVLPADYNANGVNLSANLGTSLGLFLKPDVLVLLKNGEFSEPILLKNPYGNFSFTSFASFQTNLYFFEENKNEIIKYPYLGQQKWGNPEIWLSSEFGQRTRPGASSLTVDGIVWVLNQDNSISQYRLGKLQQDITVELFPVPKKLYKVLVSPNNPYLYLLEPMQKRIIILEKSGQLVKQFQSEQFDNLKDFAVSWDGRTIWLLNGTKIYKVSF